MGLRVTGTVEVNGLRLFARHGVMPQERVTGNIFEVSVHLRYPMERAMTDDALEGTLNYAEAVGIIRQCMDVPSALLENVAWRIAEALTAAFPEISGGMVRVAKITPPIAAELQDVAVRIEW